MNISNYNNTSNKVLGMLNQTEQQFDGLGRSTISGSSPTPPMYLPPTVKMKNYVTIYNKKQRLVFTRIFAYMIHTQKEELCTKGKGLWS